MCIVSKKVADGRLYHKKVPVIDCPSKYEFTVDDKGKLYTNLREKDIETVIPPIGGDVVILKRDLRGEIGQLIERDKKKEECLV